jgi:hypothetical protein
MAQSRVAKSRRAPCRTTFSGSDDGYLGSESTAKLHTAGFCINMSLARRPISNSQSETFDPENWVKSTLYYARLATNYAPTCRRWCFNRDCITFVHTFIRSVLFSRHVPPKSGDNVTYSTGIHHTLFRPPISFPVSRPSSRSDDNRL